MRQLIVRGVEDEVVAALRRRAARRGTSAEAEHRAILRAALADDLARPSFKQVLETMPDVGCDEDFQPRRDLPRAVRW